MGKRSRQHTADEFGKQGSGLAGMDAPMIGAAGAIFSDALTERESGRTPPPPPVSVRALAIALVVMCSVGAAGLTYFISAQSARVPKPFPLTYSLWGTGSLDGNMDGFGFDSFWVATSTAEASVGDEPGYGEPEFAYDKWTVVRINDRPLSTTFSDDTTVTIYDVNGWPVHVEYRRSGGSKPPLATRIEFHAPESWIRDALGEDWTDE